MQQDQNRLHCLETLEGGFFTLLLDIGKCCLSGLCAAMSEVVQLHLRISRH